MMSFLNKTKKAAKNRLLSCIACDRRHVRGNNTEKLRAEIENVLKKYVELDGVLTIEFNEAERNRTYMTAGALIKGNCL